VWRKDEEWKVRNKHAMSFDLRIASFKKNVRFLLRFMFRLDDEHGGNLSYPTAVGLIVAVRKTQLFATQCVEDAMKSSSCQTQEEKNYKLACKIAMHSCPISVEVDHIIEKYITFKTSYKNSLKLNKLRINGLSYKIFLEYDIPFVCVLRRIWATKLPEICYETTVVPGEENETAFMHYWYDQTGTEAQNRVIDAELQVDASITHMPVAPITSEVELHLLKQCLCGIPNSLLRLPKDISEMVVKRPLGNFTILPSEQPSENFFVCEESDRFDNLSRLLVKAAQCGFPNLHPQSVFWVYSQMPIKFDEWRIKKLHLKAKMFRNLQWFPEVDQQIVWKMQQIMLDSAWQPQE
jgi:hypothetical protein